MRDGLFCSNIHENYQATQNRPKLQFPSISPHIYLTIDQYMYFLWDHWFKLSTIQTWTFPKWNRNSVNSRNLINQYSMNWSPLKDPVSDMCLTGTMVASWSPTQEVSGSSPFTVMTNIYVTELSEHI